MRKLKLHPKGIIVTLMLLLLASSGVLAQKSDCISGDCQNGHGEMKFGENSSYIGWFKNGLRDGYGYMTYKNGDSYVGEWSENLRHGHGVHNYRKHATRQRYAGEWKNNNIEGYGTMHKLAGGFETGYWNKNQFSPIKESKTCMDGNCENGWGAFIAKDGGFYIGNFKNGLPHGQGTATYKMGTRYKGGFINGKREGTGTYYQLGGNKYVGGWKADKKHGEAHLFSKGTLIAVMNYYNNTPTKKKKPEEEDIQNIGKGAEDRTAPTITILAPMARQRGVGIVTKSKKIRVHGMVRDLSGVQTVRVGGLKASLSETNGKSVNFEAYVTLSKGQNTFWVEATDIRGNVGKQDFEITHEPFDKGQAGDKNEPILMAVKDKYVVRKALVIGNSTYKDAPLRNPVNDAMAVSAKLKKFGFEVDVVLNANKEEMYNKIREFNDKLEVDSAVGLFYYAGHGLQVDGKNYIVPVDAVINKEYEVRHQAIDMQLVLDGFGHAANPLNIVILDACRDNPYAKKKTYSKKKRGGNSGGLAPITEAPTGTFMAYATSPGRLASDGEGGNGLYTTQLLNAFDNCKGLKLESFFKLVRTGVHNSSDGDQIPWDHSSVLIDFYFSR